MTGKNHERGVSLATRMKVMTPTQNRRLTLQGEGGEGFSENPSAWIGIASLKCIPEKNPTTLTSPPNLATRHWKQNDVYRCRSLPHLESPLVLTEYSDSGGVVRDVLRGDEPSLPHPLRLYWSSLFSVKGGCLANHSSTTRLDLLDTARLRIPASSSRAQRVSSRTSKIVTRSGASKR